MNITYLIIFILLNFFSWLVYMVTRRNIRQVSSSLITLLGGENKNLIITRGVRNSKKVYFFVLLLSTFVSVFFVINF